MVAGLLEGIRSGEVPMKFVLGSIPNGASTMVLWFLWSLVWVSRRYFRIDCEHPVVRGLSLIAVRRTLETGSLTAVGIIRSS